VPPQAPSGRAGRVGDLSSNFQAPREKDAAAARSSVGKKAEAADAFQVSAESWRLKEAKSAAGVGADEELSASVRTVGGVTFRREGATWVDERLLAADARHREVVKVRPFSPAYFDLAAANEVIAEWLKLGERIRVALDGMILELAPDGRDRLDAATTRKIVEAAERD
jgi:hypothetical protein